jgi:glutamate racemase
MSSGPIIGVFDSGFGGLTVLRELLPLVAGAHYVYLGDTARLPYGAKSQVTIARYAVESARFLVDHGAEMLVIACNTATALALPEIVAAVPVPVVGVIEPVVQAAHYGRQGSEVLVLATQATVQSHAYRDACARRDLHATEKACPLLVPLVEEGWIGDDAATNAITEAVLRIYLGEALAEYTPTAVLLGCTHYPLLTPLIERVLRSLGCEARVIDSASATAHAACTVAGNLKKVDRPVVLPATFECFATDSVEKFARLGSGFLGQPIPSVQLLDLGG